jgi:pimeloyl-ACP methyl ester carboxylesterase
LVALPEATVGSCLVLAPVADLALAERLDLDGGAVAAFLGTTAADRPDLDPCRLPGPVVPVAVVHGLDDSLVPIDVARTYRPPGATLVELAACAHFELIDPQSGAWPTVVDQLDRLAARALRPDRAKPTADPRSGIE